MTKEQWFKKLLAKRAERGYTAEEQAAYLADLRNKYAAVTDKEFASAHKAQENSRLIRKGAAR